MEGENDHEGTIIAGVMDITDQRNQERQIRAAESEYRNLFENAVVGIYRSRPDGTMQRANPALVRFNGYETEDKLIAAVNDISDEWYVNPIRRAEWLRQMHQNGRVTDFVSEVYRHKTREKVWISENSWTVYDSDGAPAYYEGTVVEATDRKRLEKKIEHMALHDQLTNLANRRLLTDRLEQACLRVQRYGGYFSVMCLDLDQFKAVNDAFGHSTGDLLLQKVAKRLRAAYRAEDTVARTGGDEFIVLTVGIGNPARLTLVAERVVNSFEKPFMLNGRPLSIGISIGIAVAPIDSLDPKELLAKADQALYRAKKDGRNQYRFFNESIIAQGKNKLLLLEKNRA
jgi:diguanylate cyclase (GGDEF)-like protein/PAS domain S-box-containing protein